MSDHIELTEDQFKLLKTMCDNKVKFIATPVAQPDDTAQEAEVIKSHTETLDAIMKLGFIVDATNEFKKELKQDLKKGKRPYWMLKLTEQAIQMFTPPEGVPN